MITENSVIFPSSIFKDINKRPVAEYIYNEMSYVERELVKFVLNKIDNMSYQALADILAKNSVGTFIYYPSDKEGNPVLGIDDDGGDKGTDIVIIKRMNSQVDKNDIFEARIELPQTYDNPRISKRLYFGLSIVTDSIRIYTHFHDKSSEISTSEANKHADEYADECGFCMTTIEENRKLLKKFPIKAYIDEGIDYDKIG